MLQLCLVNVGATHSITFFKQMTGDKLTSESVLGTFGGETGRRMDEDDYDHVVDHDGDDDDDDDDSDDNDDGIDEDDDDEKLYDDNYASNNDYDDD